MLEPLPVMSGIWATFHLLAHIGVMVALLSAMTFFWAIVRRMEDVLRTGRSRSHLILASLVLYVAHCPVLRVFTIEARILSDIILLTAAVTFLGAAVSLYRLPGLKDAIFSREFFTSMTAAMERFVGPAGAALQREIGFQEAGKFKVKAQRFEDTLETLERAGLGEAEVVEEGEGEVKVRVYESTLARGIRSDAPFCHIISGFLRGLAEGFYGKQCTVVETVCMAQGQASCEFTITSKG
jgi:predicted hydrocarbon binding protein